MIDFQLPMYYINRELSWLSFNERVLEEALDAEHPLLERLKFLSITCSNLDEFFMVRVAGLKDQLKAGFQTPENKTQMTPQEQLSAISERTHRLVIHIYNVLSASIIPELKGSGIQFLQADELSANQMAFIEEYYHHHIYPVLTPLGVDASRPFPMILNRSLNLAVLLENEKHPQEPNQLFAVVQVPSVLPRSIQLPSEVGICQYILLEHVICKYMQTLFQGNRIVSVSPFRITRNVDLIFEVEDDDDLLEAIEKELKKRRKGDAVRIEVDQSMPDILIDTLKDWLELEDVDIYRIEGPIDLTFFIGFVNTIKGFQHLKYNEIKPNPPKDLIGESGIFEAIAKKDILLHHPYESFEPVIHFIRQAAEDPNVLAIKQTLYRVGGNSPVVNALMRAAENGKQVTVLVELKARFDEENNIVWAKKLEEAGCHVIYGVNGLKTHSKITLVVRQEQGTIRRYVHLGTGNYNETTARIYTDLGLFTAREEFGIDASAFFNHLSGFSEVPEWQEITTAPNGLREHFIAWIENEIAQSTKENPGRIIAKMNSLTDKEIIKALYKASCAGVKIDLIVRGICCLRPGIPGVSENIHVRSIIGRFLEHSRIYYFHNGGNEQFYLASADWMTRNMIGRVEILFPVIQENLKTKLSNILQTMLLDNTKARILQSDGSYSRQIDQGAIQINSQMHFYQEAELTIRTSNVLLH
ncbi:RNA degradosome polyphosphate kinase [Fodinisporobacter ferrooxydans]|uniref:Polyphosphate kinase n=1 Tax=Fodinisporobacter ferrooxydans TaxID=2901836 RepID=A0ABY4CGT8_9BACL|nr:RNA degradosome polyphosphate kinase [Alicyclobacillaceae bacterium MYW30-H2]